MKGSGIIIVVIATLMLTLLSQCTDQTTAPKEYTPDGYKVYFFDNGDNPKWYIYYPEEDYLDSVYFSISDGYSVSISPDGSRIYWNSEYGGVIVVVYPFMGERIPELMTLTGNALIEFSPDQQKMLFRGDHWYLLDYETQDTLAVDTVTSTFNHLRFSSDGNYVYGASRSDGRYQYTIFNADNFEKVSADSLTEVFPLYYNIWTYLGEDLTSWYILAFAAYDGNINYQFFEWNSDLDSIQFVYQLALTDIDLDLKATNDGNYLVFTNPGKQIDSAYMRPCQFLIYDRTNRTIVDAVDTRYITENDTTYYNVEEFVITPDCKYLLGISSKDENLFLVYNLEKLAVERWVTLQGNHRFSNLLCQSRL